MRRPRRQLLPLPETTELPAVGWTPPAAGAYEPPPTTAPATTAAPATTGEPAGSSPAEPSWTTDETRNFPAYQPQSYPTYPPNHSPTTELPAVAAGGPPPSSAAAYAGTCGRQPADTARSSPGGDPSRLDGAVPGSPAPSD